MEKAHRLVFNPSLMSPDNLNNSFCTFVDLASLDNPPALCRSSGRMVLEEARTVIIAKMPKKWMLEWQLRLPLQPAIHESFGLPRIRYCFVLM